jgi:hypothetical protein
VIVEEDRSAADIDIDVLFEIKIGTHSVVYSYPKGDRYSNMDEWNIDLLYFPGTKRKWFTSMTTTPIKTPQLIQKPRRSRGKLVYRFAYG